MLNRSVVAGLFDLTFPVERQPIDGVVIVGGGGLRLVGFYLC